MDGDTADLVSLLRDSQESSIVAAAARALGKRGDREAVPHLIAALESPKAAVRKAAATALGKLGDPRARKPLRALIQAGDSLGRVASTALLAVGTKDDLDAILDTFEENGWLLKPGEAASLARFADRRAVPLLVRSTERYVWSGQGIDADVLHKVFGQVWERG